MIQWLHAHQDKLADIERLDVEEDEVEQGPYSARKGKGKGKGKKSKPAEQVEEQEEEEDEGEDRALIIDEGGED